ncbi:MAG: DEAD/DEAH box helicase [Gemmatimonadaceae bacterium]|nr:DEAD/DEAH box helicase [Gemmatimonadaceae bacterium]
MTTTHPGKRSRTRAPRLSNTEQSQTARPQAGATPEAAESPAAEVSPEPEGPLETRALRDVVTAEPLVEGRAASFESLGLAPSILEAVAAAGYVAPTPIQREAIPLAMHGRDVMGLAQTGTGKTAAFTLPIIHRLLGGPKRLRCLILTPTRELCHQVDESFRKYGEGTGVEVAPIYGGVAYDAQEKALERGVDVIVATPGRFIDHMEKRNASLDSLEILVLDEADRMLDMGFAPQINRIVSGISPYRQTLLFSATMPPEVEALARKYLRRPVVVQVGRRSAAASTVRHAVYPVPRVRKNDLLVELLRKPEMDSVLVFTRTKHGADHVVRDLHAAGVEATAMHADKTQAQRTQAIERFKLGEIRVLVATDIAQRGLDISGISHVINYDVPSQAEDYVHRIGRTGRAAATGDAFTFMSADEIAMVRTIERVLGKPIERISIPGFDFGTVAETD